MTKPGPGKFEGNESLETAQALYEITGYRGEDESFGSVDENGRWVAIIVNGFLPDENLTAAAYIVEEDSNGFFTYTEYETSEAAWEAYFADLAAYESYYANGEA